MLKGSREAVLRRIQPVSIHGQMSWEIVFTNADDPAEQLNAARVGPEAIVGESLELEHRKMLRRNLRWRVRARLYLAGASQPLRACVSGRHWRDFTNTL